MTVLDVSYHQGTIDWEKVAVADHAAWPGGMSRSPVEAAIIKATGEEIGRLFQDSAFKRNWLNAKVAGVRRGAYHFMNGKAGTASGRDEAMHFLEIVHQAGGFREGDVLPVLDVEWPPQGGQHFEARQMDDYIVTMQEQGGATPILYSGRWYLDAIKDRDLTDFMKQCPLWLASYTPTCPKPPRPWDSVALWQFTDKGRVDGIAGPVDLNQRFALWGMLTL